MASDPTVFELMGTKQGSQCRKLVLNFGSVESMGGIEFLLKMIYLNW